VCVRFPEQTTFDSEKMQPFNAQFVYGRLVALLTNPGSSKSGKAIAHGWVPGAYSVTCEGTLGSCYVISNDGGYVDIDEAVFAGGPLETYTLTVQ